MVVARTMCHVETKSARPFIAPSSEPVVTDSNTPIKPLSPYFHGSNRKSRSDGRKLSTLSTSRTPAARREASAGFRWWVDRGPGVVGGPMCGSSTESLGRGWPMKSLVFPRIINIYDVILWRHLLTQVEQNVMMQHDNWQRFHHL